MSKRMVIYGVLAFLGSAAALAQAPAQPDEPGGVPDEVRAQVESCGRYKFETIVDTNVDGTPRKQRVRLCGVEAKNDSDWVRTLSEMIGKVEDDGRLSADAKIQIVGALRTEISKFKPAEPEAASAVSAPAVPSIVAEPQPPVAPVAVVPPPPAPAPAASFEPRLIIRCSTPGDPDPRPCVDLERDTLITVQAEEALPDGAARLVFLRRGSLRGEVALAQMPRGSSRRLGLPRQLCSGVVSSQVEIQILSRGGGGSKELIDTLGPYRLSC